MHRNIGLFLDGGWRQMRSLPSMMRYHRLQQVHGFHPWHVRSPYSRRPYKARVVEMVNGLAPDTVVEIGCGLGEIIIRTKARHRFGFDQEQAAISAATAFHQGVGIFHHGAFQAADAIAAAVGRPIDVLVAVNWPHMLCFDEIVAAVTNLKARLPVSMMIVDTIRPDRSGYEHYHTLDDIQRLGKVHSTRCGGDNIRDIHAVRLHSAA